MNARIGTAAALLVAPLALLVVSRDAAFTDLAAFSPMFFPRTVLWGWAAVAALSLAGELVAARAGGGPPDERLSRATLVRLLVVTLAMGAYVGCVMTLGFLLSSIGFTLATLLVLGIRSPLLLVGYGLLMPGAVFALFNHALGLPLPTSPFSYLF